MIQPPTLRLLDEVHSGQMLGLNLKKISNFYYFSDDFLWIKLQVCICSLQSTKEDKIVPSILLISSVTQWDEFESHEHITINLGGQIDFSQKAV